MLKKRVVAIALRCTFRNFQLFMQMYINCKYCFLMFFVLGFMHYILFFAYIYISFFLVLFISMCIFEGKIFMF